MTQLSVYADYLTRVQEYANSAQNDETARYHLFRLIDEYLASQPEQTSQEQMLRGEKAFYQGNYELALKHYLKAHDLPDFHFFCYRASAYVSYKMGKTNKAFFFSKKAIKLHPEDAYTRHIYELLKHLEGEESSSSEIFDSQQECAQECYSSPDDEPVSSQNAEPSLTQELEELSHIFQERLSLNESLFSQEEKAPSPYYQEKESHPKSYPEYKSERLASNEKGLEERILSFQKEHKDWVSDYREKAKKSRIKNDDLFLVLNGWEQHLESDSTLPHLLQLQQLKKTTGGLYLRWSGKGIAINPGIDFLERLHREGLYVNDIDVVIVTRDTPEAYADLQSIYNLNYQLNRDQHELHIINYYLNQRAYQNVSRILKPNFKQERNTIHCLDLFLDSPDVEKIQINEEITLNYFPTTWGKSNKESSETREYNASSTYGITLELKHSHRRTLTGSNSLRIGYISGTPWSPMLAAGLGKCDLLVTGVDGTNTADWSRRAYNTESLGYYGIYTLLEEVVPKILVCTEFSGSDGDIRLEFTKKLRRDYAQHIPRTGQSAAILPGDTGLYINLTNLKVRCSFSNTLIDPDDLHIVKLRDFFGKLQYLSPNCLI